jgi:carboxyl-terminal processing protease
MSVIKGSPAEAAGLKAHDSIYSIDGQAVTEAEGLDVVNRVRGEAGTDVTLEVSSPGAFKRTVKVTRGKVTAADTLQAFLLGDARIVYLRFPVSPDASLAQQIAGVMQTIEAQGPGVNGLVLDLRVARSSGDWPLSQMLTLFGTGKLGEFYTRKDSTPISIEGVDVGGSQKLPIAILVGPDTEGQSEIFAAALQASGRATVIGLPTAGKIFGYSTLPLPDGSRLTVAVSSYKTQAGNDLSNTGVKPDLALPDDWDQVDDGNDPLIIKAVDVILNKPTASVTK